MEQNRPLDKSALMSMLAKSKKIIDKVETGSFEKGNVNSEKAYQSGDNLVENVNPNQQPQTSTYNPNPNGIPQTHKNLHSSKMDPKILEAMVNNPIIPEQAHVGSTFTVEDAQGAGFNTQPTYNQPTYNQPVSQQNQPIQSYSGGERMITMTESELDSKIKSALLDFMTTTFTKSLTESTIKKTIGTLIKEGKIRVKKK